MKHHPNCKYLSLEQYANRIGEQLPESLRNTTIKIVVCDKNCPIHKETVRREKEISDLGWS